MGKMLGVGHWSGIPDRGWDGFQTHGTPLQTGVGFQSCGGIPDTGGVPDRDGGVPDRDDGVLDRNGGVPERWWYTRCR